MDVSEYLKSEYQSLYKVKKSFGYALNDARITQNNHRRMTRNAEILTKRRINEETLSPYLTPSRKKTPKKKVVDKTKSDAKSKRFEQFLAWKQEKEKKKQEQKQKVKPMFKVTHVPVAIGLPNLENVNKQIKGKLIAPKHNETYKFAPANHKFKAPSNIKPMKIEPVKHALNTGKPADLNISSFRRITRSQKVPLLTLELPSTQRKLNTKKDAGKVTPTKQPKVETEKHVPKNRLHSAKPKKVALLVGNKTPKSSNRVYQKTPAKIKSFKKTTESTTKDKQTNLVQTNNSKLAEAKSTKVMQNETKTKAIKECETPGKYVSLINHKSGGTSRKSRRLSKNEGIITSSNDTQIECCDSSKQVEVNEKQRKSSVQVNNLELRVELERIKFSEGVSERELINDYKTPVKSKRASMKKRRSHYTGHSSRKSRHSSEKTEDITSNTEAESCDSPKSIKRSTKQQRKSRNDYLLPEYPIGDIVGCSNVNTEDVTSNMETETYDGPKDIKRSIKKQRKSRKDSLSAEYPVEDVVNSNDGDNECVTPHKKAPVAYISPFVTISRGKSSARKEYFQRKSRGGECNLSPEVRRSTGPKAGAAYFQRILEQEISRIQGLCDKWANVKDTQDPPEEALDMINVAIGQSKLLISKKFKQFQGLIKTCELRNSEVPVTCEDLHGYWDVAYIQVENLNKRFENLENLKQNNWKEILPQTNKVQVKKKLEPKKPKVKVTSILKDAIKAARAKAKSQKPECENQTENTSTFDGKFFTITSPHKSPLTKFTEVEPSGKTPRKSLRVTVLSFEASKRKSTPGWNSIKASRMAVSATGNKENQKFTLNRSILKSSQSVKKAPTKSVLFKDNIGVNLNETYPPANFNEKPSDVFPVLTNITNGNAQNVQGRQKPKRRSFKNKLF